MTTPTWPSALPYPNRSPYNYQPADLVLRSQMQGGPMRSRQIASFGPTIFNIGFALNATEWRIFEGFLTHELGDGAAAFRLPLKTGTGVALRLVKFMGPPSYDPSGGPARCVVTATVQLMEKFEMSLSDYYVATYPDVLSQFDRLVNVVAPSIWN